MTVGERIRIYRKQANLTQKELGKKLGTTNVNIGQYERGLRNPKLPQLKRIADALGIPFELLVADKVESLKETSQEIDPSIIQAFEQGEFEEKLTHIAYNLVDTGDECVCHPKEGTPFPISHEDIREINAEVNSYLKYLLFQLAQKERHG